MSAATGQLLPHAAAICRRAITELHMHGETSLARELASINGAIHDLVRALHAESEATDPLQQASARREREAALHQLRGSNPA